jgi:Flp pilus assembly protein TadD
VPRVPAELFDVADVEAWCRGCLADVPGLAAHLRVRREVYASDAFLGGSLGQDARPPLPTDPELAAAVARSPYLRRLFGGEEYDALVAGQGLLERGQPELAVFALERAVLGASNDPEASEALGRAYFGRGDLPAAAATLAWTVTLAPARASAHVALGSVLRAQGRLAEAEGVLRFAVELDPLDPDAHYELAAVLSDLERPGEADVELDATVELDPNHSRANAVLCRRALAAGDATAAGRACDAP